MSVVEVTPGRRGSLEVARGVLEKIAGQAALEVAAVGGIQGSLLGIGGHADLASRPRAEVTLVGDRAEVRLRIAVGYPTSLRAATDAVRDAVVERLRTLCGVPVSRVNIEVTALTALTARTAVSAAVPRGELR